jgi:plasmid stability protein
MGGGSAFRAAVPLGAGGWKQNFRAGIAKRRFRNAAEGNGVPGLALLLAGASIVPISNQRPGAMPMANLSIRNLDEEIVSSLRTMAERDGVSMEEEIRRILRRAATPPEPIGDLAVRLFATVPAGEPLEIPARETSEPLQFPR